MRGQGRGHVDGSAARMREHNAAGVKMQALKPELERLGPDMGRAWAELRTVLNELTGSWLRSRA